MREIKFRAWDKINRKMFKGSSEVRWENGTVEWNEQMIPLQYTGLLDKNGEEIYEGDIINSELFGVVSAVEWGYGYSAWVYRDGLTPIILSTTDFTDMEVIGNIYENPKLLSRGV